MSNDTLKDNARKCSRERWCKPLDDRIESTWGERKRGLSVLETIECETNTRSVVGVVYRLSAKDKGLMLNFCPWCGEKILWEKE